MAWQAAAFVAGLAFAFTPLRAVAVPHIQTMATFGVPLCLVGLHGYVRDRHWSWLVLFGLGWVHQGFANGYYILYGGLMAGLWVLYFCSTRMTARAIVPIVVTGAVASLPLVPMLLKYARCMTRRACAGHWRRSSISAQGRSPGLKWGSCPGSGQGCSRQARTTCFRGSPWWSSWCAR